MLNPTRRAVAIVALAAAIVAGAVALDLPSVAAQSDDEQTGRIVARRLDDGRTEFGWQPSGGARVLPSARYFPADAQVPEGEQVGRWLNSSPVEVEGEAIGRINARLHADGRIEFAFTPTDRERILTDARYFPAAPRPNRWLRSTEITIGPMLRYVAISALTHHNCAIDETGAIVCWGSNEDAPEGSFITVSAGEGNNACAIAETFETAVSNASASGEIECWGWAGDGDRSLTDAPSGRFTAVVSASEDNCAIRAGSGEIECWGLNEYGESDAPAGSFTAVAAGYEHLCAIRAGSGEIECWGLNEGGQTDAPEGSFSAVAAGTAHTCGLRESGAIECWGLNNFGQTDAPSGSFSAVAAGRGHSCAIRTESGAIECWGLNNFGQTDAPTP